MLLRLSLLALCYLLGSIPFGYLIVRQKAGADIRQSGSGGTGATNVLRKAGKGAAALTFFGDFAKGAIAVWLMKLATNNDWSWVAAAAVVVVVGHIYTIWLGFQGGKGVATGLGVFLVLSPLSALSALVIFSAIVAATRYVSLGSIIGTSSVLLWLWLYEKVLLARPSETVFKLEIAALLAASLIVGSHWQNIKRLLNGTENKLGTQVRQ